MQSTHSGTKSQKRSQNSKYKVSIKGLLFVHLGIEKFG